MQGAAAGGVYFATMPIPILLLALGLAFAVVPASASSGAPADAPPFSLAPKALLEMAGPPDAANSRGATILLHETTLVISADQRVAERRHTIFRIDRPEAVAGAQLTVPWHPWRQGRPAVRARVVTTDGVQHDLDASTLTDGAPNQQADLYQDFRILTGPLPALAVGAVVEQTAEVSDTQPFFAAGFVRHVGFGGAEPVLRSRLVVEAPASLPLKHAVRLLPNLVTTREADGPTVRLRFEQGRLEALEAPEPGLPPSVPTTPLVTISTAASWADVARQYASIVDRQLEGADLAPLLKAANQRDRAAVIASVVAALHREVRYTGVEFGQAALVPRAPKEVLARKYGDCKDKAALLVAALRAKGIAAHLALLSVGPGFDVEPELPGMGAFDHAIVFVPGTPDTWIDATAAFHPAGALPFPDRNRQALVVAPDTTGLRPTPATRPGDNALIETREIDLPDLGNARVTATSEARGEVDAVYRALFGSSQSSEFIKALQVAAKRQFRADGEARYEHGDGADLAKPFRLTVTVEKSGLASTDMDNAAVTIDLAEVVRNLPPYLQGGEAGPAAQGAAGPSPRKEDMVFAPFVFEWRYRVKPPEAFRVNQLPESRERALGPARLSQSFRAEPDGTVSGTLRLDSVRDRYSPSEVEAVRQAARELRKADDLKITFAHTGAVALAAGKTREALAIYRGLAAKHASESLQRRRFSRALLTAGLGEPARAEARAAAAAEPTSAACYVNLGDVLTHDLFGRRWSRGFDRAGAIEAYRKAIALEPSNGATRMSLGVALEHDADGTRYTGRADLAAAIEEYRALEKSDKATFDRYAGHLLYALFYHRDFAELRTRLASRTSASDLAAITLAATAAVDGPAAALAEASRLVSDQPARSRALGSASTMLRNLRLYGAAADLLAATDSASTDSNAPSVISLLRTARPFETILLPPSDPRSLAQRMTVDLSDPDRITADTVRDLGEYLTAPAKERLTTMRAQAARLKVSLLRTHPSLPVGIDLSLADVSVTVEGDASRGFKLRMQRSNGTWSGYAAVRDGLPRLVGLYPAFAGAGREVIRRLDAGDTAGARQWLDWVREDIRAAGGDDPLAGPMFPWLWNRGDPPEPARMKVAALALLADDEDIVPHLDELRQARARADGAEQSVIDAVLIHGLVVAANWSEARDVARRVLTTRQDSLFAFVSLTEACRRLRDFDGWDAAITARLQRLPDDRDALRSRANLLVARGRVEEARVVLKGLIDSGRAEAGDLNNYAWQALFTGAVADADVQAGQRSSAMLQNREPAVLHTLACLFADVGRTKEAWDAFLRALDARGLQEPDSSLWFVYGRIAEQYGETATAAAAYRRVEPAEAGEEPVTSTRQLAEKRLAALR